jgi:hypothetical protein
MMSSGLQRAEVSSPPSTVRGSTESANTPCPADGVANAPSTAPIISIADANARTLSRSFALPLQRSYRILAAVKFATCRKPSGNPRRTNRALVRKASWAVQLNEHTAERGDIVFRHACKLGFEGIVSKRLGSPYCLQPLTALDQDEEPGSARSEAGSEGGLGGPLKVPQRALGHPCTVASYSAGRDIPAKLIPEPSTGTKLDITATDQIRPIATTTAIPTIHARICIPSTPPRACR